MNQIIIDSDNGLSPARSRVIIWTNESILLVGPVGTNFSDMWIKIKSWCDDKEVKYNCKLPIRYSEIKRAPRYSKQRLYSVFNIFFRLMTKKTSNLHITSHLSEPSMRNAFPCHEITVIKRTHVGRKGNRDKNGIWGLKTLGKVYTTRMY